MESPRSPLQKLKTWEYKKLLSKEFYKVDPCAFRLLEIKEAQKQIDILTKRIKKGGYINKQTAAN